MNLTKLLRNNTDLTTYELKEGAVEKGISLTKGVRDILEIGDNHRYFEEISHKSPMLSLDNDYSKVLFAATHRLAFFSFVHKGEFALFGISQGILLPSQMGMWKVGSITIDGKVKPHITHGKNIEDCVIFHDPHRISTIDAVGFHGADLSEETLLHGLKLINKFIG